MSVSCFGEIRSRCCLRMGSIQDWQVSSSLMHARSEHLEIPPKPVEESSFGSFRGGRKLFLEGLVELLRPRH